jgi:hypothetical protein
LRAFARTKPSIEPRRRIVGHGCSPAERSQARSTRWLIVLGFVASASIGAGARDWSGAEPTLRVGPTFRFSGSPRGALADVRSLTGTGIGKITVELVVIRGGSVESLSKD